MIGISCLFLITGYLDSSSESEHLQPGTKLELPFWMARALCSRKRHIVSVDLPKQYKEGYREIFSADPTMVDLHKLGPYFYNYGSQLLQFELPETPDVSKSLLQVCFYSHSIIHLDLKTKFLGVTYFYLLFFFFRLFKDV